MDGDIIGVILKDFGPAGGLAILLLAASIWANWKLVTRLNKMHDASVAAEKTHAGEMAECHMNCEKEKTAYREQLEKRYQEATALFLMRDDQKRVDAATMFTRFENLLGIVTEALSKWTEAIQDLRFLVREGQNRRT